MRAASKTEFGGASAKERILLALADKAKVEKRYVNEIVDLVDGDREYTAAALKHAEILRLKEDRGANLTVAYHISNHGHRDDAARMRKMAEMLHIEEETGLTARGLLRRNQNTCGTCFRKLSSAQDS